jgi:hypothetical protein
MATEQFQGKITTFRLRNPREDRELEVRLESADYDNVDAVFTSVNAVERILKPFYEKEKPGEWPQIAEQLQRQRLGPVCVTLHKYRCTLIVPPINWEGRSPITL